MGNKDGFIDQIEGVQVGDAFAGFREMMAVGLYGVVTQGIWSKQGVGVSSIVLNGGYPGDQDQGGVIFYTGSEGQDPTTKRQIAHQSLAPGQNATLDLNRQTGKPVRVARGWKGDPNFNPGSGYRYDGVESRSAKLYVRTPCSGSAKMGFYGERAARSKKPRRMGPMEADLT